MIKTNTSPLYHRHRFPPDVIAQAIWLYFRFPLSLRMVEDLLADRGITVSGSVANFLEPCCTSRQRHSLGYVSTSHSRFNRLISFKGAHYPKSVILYAVYFYVRFAVSYRDLEEIMAERGVDVDHATLNRWVEKYASIFAEQAHRRKALTGRSWRMDETYVKVKGQWTYLYRAIDKCGNTLDFMLSERRDEAAATAFFAKVIASNGWPDKVVIDKSGSNTAGLFNMNCLLVMHNWCWLIEVLQVKYLNNNIEHPSR